MFPQNCPEYITAIMTPIIACLSDNNANVRYYATESLYNVVRVARHHVMPVFSELFTAITTLATDTDTNVRSGADMLDTTMKVRLTRPSGLVLTCSTQPWRWGWHWHQSQVWCWHARHSHEGEADTDTNVRSGVDMLTQPWRLYRYSYAPPRCRTSQCRRTFVFSQCPSGTVLLSPYSMVWDWLVSRAGPMLFHWHNLLKPYYSLLLFFHFTSFCLYVGIFLRVNF